MKQTTLKVAGTAALGVAIAATAVGTASAAAAGGLTALPDTGGLTGTLNQAPAVGGPVTSAMGTLDKGAGTQAQAPAAQAPAADAPAAAPSGATRGLPVGALGGVAKQAPGPVGGLLGSAAPVSGGLPLG
ncbi:hypothetical protein OG455_24350 [Kitasatospora sp. NBC_01287]|uniref:hypothetical protein n=1 Tax=Kitasatospora sp. NBC_01287 TaxID=2903573 RepID=UPI00224EA65F|nr:hypothetical protein [Kitasatospora sp. NBC_01287]MCX4748611.1 hypothetical protein [Kitasatospora sp. NBC_01287]